MAASVAIRRERSAAGHGASTPREELALGFWAAGYYGRSAVLLVAWVAAFAIIRGARDIVAAFRARELQHPKPAS